MELSQSLSPQKVITANICRKRISVRRFGSRRHRQCANNDLFSCQRTIEFLLTLRYGKLVYNVMYYQLLPFGERFR